MPWYDGLTLIEHIEWAYRDKNAPRAISDTLRLSVQAVVREGQKRTYLGLLHSGRLLAGDKIICSDGDLPALVDFVSQPGANSRTVAFTLDRQIDCGRGALFYDEKHVPQKAKEIEATIIWLSSTPSHCGRNYLIRHRTFETQGRIVMPAGEHLEMNQIRPKTIMYTSRNLVYDAYKDIKETGSFIVIDSQTFETVAAGVI
jgi:bifunctional enzyme CysN/CysC